MIKKIMKKSINFCLVLLLTIALVSCKGKEKNPEEPKESLPRLAEVFISEINEISIVTIESKDQLDLCLVLYSCLEETYIDALEDEQVVAAKSKLDTYITTYNELKEEAYNDNKNTSLIESFINAVLALPSKDLLKVEDLEKIIIAENSYKSLSSASLSNEEVVSKKAILEDIRTEYNALISMDADAYNAHKFVTSVMSLPAVEELELSNLADITAITLLYELLTSEHLGSEKVTAAKSLFDTYLEKAAMLQASQDKATAFIMAVFSLPTGSGLKYQNAEQRAEIEAAYSLYNELTEFEKTITGVSEAYEELNVVKAQFEALKEPYDISKVKPTHLCLYYYDGPKKLTFTSGADPRSILIKDYGLTAENIKDNVKIYLDVYVEAGALPGSPLFSIEITENYNVTVNDIVQKLNELKAAGNETIKTQGYTFTIHIESLNDQYANSDYSSFFSSTQIPIA